VTEAERTASADWRTVFLCAFVYFLDGMLPTMLGPLAPAIAHEFQLGPAAMGPLFSATVIGQSAGLVLMPVVAKSIGHRASVVLSLAGLGLFQMCTGFAPGFGALFALRVAEGFFLGGALPSAMVLVARAVPPARRGTAVMSLFVGLAAGATMAGFVSRHFVDGSDWRILLSSSGAFALAMGVTLHWFLRPRNDAAEQQAAKGRLRQIAMPPFLTGTLMLWALFVCAYTIFYALTYWLPSLLVSVGRSREVGAYATMAFNFGGLAASLLIGLLIDRFGERRTLISMFSITALLLPLCGAVLVVMPDFQFILLLTVTGFFLLSGYAGINVVLVSYYPDALRAVGAGWAKSVGRLGTIVSPVLVGLALQYDLPAGDILIVFAVPAVIAAAILWWIGKLSVTRAEA